MRGCLVFLLISIFFHLRNCLLLLNSAPPCNISLSHGDYEEFESAIEKLHNCMVVSKEIRLTLQNYSLPAFPNGAFSNFGHLRRLKLEIGGNSKIQLLLPGLPRESLFHNSWFDSVIFDISDLFTLVGWRWTILEDLNVQQEGFEFNAVRSNLVYLHPDFGKVAKGYVTVVRILKCQLRWLGKKVFGPLSNLKTLELRDNLIESIERSQLPATAPKLRTLDLGNNKLKTLPSDFADGLNLESVFLGGNNLKIAQTQAKAILSAGNFPLLVGVLWPCICYESSKTSEVSGMHYEGQKCYKGEDTSRLFNYQETCSH